MILPFEIGDPVLWRGAAARVIEIRGERIALTRLSDEMTVITTDAMLRTHQVALGARERAS